MDEMFTIDGRGRLVFDDAARELAGAEEDARQVHVQDLLPGLEGHGLDLARLLVGTAEEAVAGDARVVHQAVETARELPGLLNEGDDLGLVGDVGLVAVDLAGQAGGLGDEAAEAVVVHVGGDDRPAGLGQGEGEVAAHAAGATGDDAFEVLEFHGGTPNRVGGCAGDRDRSRV
jgi:hypothetical protein